MSQKLTSQQQQAIDKFTKLKVGALFMKMGTGKTRVGLEIVKNANPDFLLYLAPVSTLKNLDIEIQKWGCPCDYRLVGYESIASSDKIYEETIKLVDNDKKCFIIADESIFIKNKRSKRYERALNLRSYCEWALILNGTPITRDEFDLINQINFLSQKILPFNSYEIIEKFFVENKIRKNGRETTYFTFFEPNRPVLMKLIAPYVFEADLNFEHKVEENVIWVKPTVQEIYGYDKCKNDTIQKYVNREAGEIVLHIINETQKYVSLLQSKNQKVIDYIKGKKLICFCHYREEIEQISKMIDCYVITGDTTIKERNKILNDFKLDTNKPLLMTLGVGSYSLNLQFCNEIVYSSLSYDFAALEQSKHRVKRIGQENNIRYTYILSKFAINDMIFKNLDKKQSLSDVVKDLLENDENVANFIKQTKKRKKQ